MRFQQALLSGSTSSRKYRLYRSNLIYVKRTSLSTAVFLRKVSTAWSKFTYEEQIRFKESLSSEPDTCFLIGLAWQCLLYNFIKSIYSINSKPNSIFLLNIVSDRQS